MRVLNLWGGPGSGKSTLAAGVFFLAKSAGLSVEYVPEWIKPFAYTVKQDGKWPANWEVLEHQSLWISRFDGHVDWVVTDSPIRLQLAYLDDPQDRDRVNATWPRFDNVDVWVQRRKAYVPSGRREDEASARAVDERLRREHPEPFAIEVPGTQWSAAFLVEELLSRGQRT